MLNDHNLDSRNHAISFLNDNDSPVSIKPLTKSLWNIKICVDTATDPELS